FAVEVHLPANADARKAIDRLHGRVVQLGGRGHHARVEVLERRLMPTELDGAAGPARKLWFLTPAPLRPGLGAWPEGVTVVADRLLPVGGFDQANRRPRPLLRALPAGSVVYLEPTRHPHDVRAELCGFSDGAPADIKDELERLRQAGFGMALPIGAEGGES
ncbi:MAG: hypothetical protein MUF34_38415, partial [Polyangiaceae bacterium]|nr:hypothetical protein [Polyangiaceae bacterium]